jgi:hypothetical protein
VFFIHIVVELQRLVVDVDDTIIATPIHEIRSHVSSSCINVEIKINLI